MKKKKIRLILIYPFLPYSFSSTPQQKSFNLPWTLAAWPSTKIHRWKTTGVKPAASSRASAWRPALELKAHSCKVTIARAKRPAAALGRGPSVRWNGRFKTGGTQGLLASIFFENCADGFSLCHLEFSAMQILHKKKHISSFHRKLNLSFHSTFQKRACNRTRFNLFGANSISPSQAIGGCPHHGSDRCCCGNTSGAQPRHSWSFLCWMKLSPNIYIYISIPVPSMYGIYTYI